MRLRAAILGALLTATTVAAQSSDGDALRDMDRAALVDFIRAQGQNQSEHTEERHAVDVEGCDLITYRWKPAEDGSEVLWTSFRFHMAAVTFDSDKKDSGNSGVFAMPDKAQKGLANLMIIAITAKEGQTIRHEKPLAHRPPKGAFEMSPRGNGTTHYYHDQTSVIIMQQGPGVIEKAKSFVGAYRAYRDRYCTFIG